MTKKEIKIQNALNWASKIQFPDDELKGCTAIQALAYQLVQARLTIECLEHAATQRRP